MQTLSHRHAASVPVDRPLRKLGIGRVLIGHALVDNYSLRQACKAIIAHARARETPAHVITSNAQHIVLLNSDVYLRDIYQRADLVVADGVSLLMAARLQGQPLQERVAGVDLLRSLCGLAAESSMHVFMLGGRPGSAEFAANVLRQDFPDLVVSTFCPPYGFERTPTGLREAAEAVRAAQPHLLFVALGAPKQEYWIYEHGLQLSTSVCIGVGGSFEIIGGVVPRAPLWIQKLGCEWLYRLCREPRRMWRRYLVGNLAFVSIILRKRFRTASTNP